MRKIRKTRSRYGRHRFSKTQFVLSLLLLATCGIGAWVFYAASSAKSTDDWFESKAPGGTLVFLPKDDAPHQAAMEWWYYNGHLTSESGKQFSFHHTVFLANSMVQHMVSHASLNDYQTGKHYTAQRRTAGNPSTSTKNRFEFVHGDWLMLGDDGDDQLKIIADDFSFELGLTSTQAPVFHGGDGVISLNAAGSSYYYSRTRMAVAGTITIGNTTEKVTGLSWFDHQWGDFSVGLLAWDWFSLQLNDGIDVMIYQLRDKTNKPILYTGSVSQNGITESLLASDFTIVPGKKWTSAKSNIAYPVAWTIDIPQRNISVSVQSINDNSEFDAMLTTYNIYWEGAVKVEGSHTGLGFMELYHMSNKH